MDDKTQQERLEQELRFLKESFEAEVISKEEFEKGKERIEKKLKQIDKTAKKSVEEKPAEAKKEETNTEEAKKEEPKTEVQEQKAEETKETLKEETKNITPKAEEAAEEQKPPEAKKPEEKTKEEKPKEDKKEGNKAFKYAVVFVVLVLAVFFLYSFFTSSAKSQEKFVPLCKSNKDCTQEGKEGICLKPGTKDAKCEFREIQKTNVIVLNDKKDCFNCDTQRVLSILESWFGAISPKEIDYNSNQGKSLAEKFNAEMLPLYVLEENITKKQNFEQFKQVFIKKEGNYVLSDNVASSTLYYKRENIPNKLDLFVKEGDAASTKAENNLREFLDTFKEVKFEKHLSNDNLTEELGVKVFPTFLVNNKVKFSGVHPAETIKTNFCKLNKLAECEKSLSKSLVS
ncbi:cell envelope integrity protein TolA [Candidatus Woesearchaeota archaeon]|nr:cell envelope integrity protein TolA [Candidatus Woesearchaeota archaeon]